MFDPFRVLLLVRAANLSCSCNNLTTVVLFLLLKMLPSNSISRGSSSNVLPFVFSFADFLKLSTKVLVSVFSYQKQKSELCLNLSWFNSLTKF